MVLIAFTVLAGYAWVSSWSSSYDEPGKEGSMTSAATPPATNTYSRPVAPEFRVVDIDGNTISLSDYRGKYVIVWFMASWCPSCIYMSNIISQAVDGRDDVVVIMIDMWSKEFLEEAGILGKPGYPPPDTVDMLRSFKEKYGMDEWIAVMDNGSLVDLYNVRYIDTVFVVDRDGSIVLGGGNIVTVESLKLALGG